MKKFTFVKDNDELKMNIVCIRWISSYRGSILEISYKADGNVLSEKEIYEAFVKGVDQAVKQGVLPETLFKHNWYDWKLIESKKVSPQYSIITDPDNLVTLFWKSTFVTSFFVSAEN